MKLSQQLTIVFAALLPFATCQKSPKIVNGTDAHIAEFPFLVSLQYESSHECGGSLLNDQWIVTAGHCLAFPPDQMTVAYATTQFSDGFKGTKIAYVEKYVFHEDYDFWSLTNDIGLIKLKEPINTGLQGSAVKLAVPGKYYPTGTPTTVAGWGRIGTDQPTSPILQKVDLQIYSYHDCKAALAESARNLGVRRTNICAGVPEMGKSECNGDSGGPLMVNGVLVGLSSWSVKPCAVAPFPGIFTDINHYVSWISEKTGIKFSLDTFMIRDV